MVLRKPTSPLDPGGAQDLCSASQRSERFLGGQVPEGGPVVGKPQTFSGNAEAKRVSFLLCVSTDACCPARLAGLPRGKAAAEGREGPPCLGGISAPLDPAALPRGGGISSLSY